MRKAILGILIVICLGVLGYSGYHIISQQLEYRKSDKAYEELQDYRDTDTGRRAHTLDPVGDAARAKNGDLDNPYLEVELPEVDFDALLERNPDTIGWIYCADTHIDYPVVQGPDNDYYLHRLFDGGYSAAGTIFLDAECASDFSYFHSILYGHHMKNGSMFRDLEKFKDEEFFRAHPYLILMTPETNYVIEVFAGYVSSVTEDSWKIEFTDGDDMTAWIEECIEKSNVDTGVVPANWNRLITLSTCSYEYHNARYVLHGILHELSEE